MGGPRKKNFFTDHNCFLLFSRSETKLNFSFSPFVFSLLVQLHKFSIESIDLLWLQSRLSTSLPEDFGLQASLTRRKRKNYWDFDEETMAGNVLKINFLWDSQRPRFCDQKKKKNLEFWWLQKHWKSILLEDSWRLALAFVTKFFFVKLCVSRFFLLIFFVC